MRLSNPTGIGRLKPIKDGPNKAFQVFAIFLILFIYSLFFLRPVNFAVSDLGRHLKNGEIFFNSLSIPSTNLYSYTCTGFPFLNHHWLSGVVFFVIKAISGFAGLSVFAALLKIATFLIFFHIAWRFSRFEIAVLVSLITLPLLVSRTEIRPEAFSYFFSAVYFWILWNHAYGRVSRRWLFLLPALEILWVNLHIYFLLGPLLIGVFILGCLPMLSKAGNRPLGGSLKTLILILALSLLATLVNPYGIKLALYPFLINRGYFNIALESQGFITLQKDILNGLIVFPPAGYFKLNLWLLSASWVFALLRARKEGSGFIRINIMLSALFCAMAVFAVRNFALFGYFSICIISVNLAGVIRSKASAVNEQIIFFALLLIILVNLFLFYPQYWPKKQDLGIGLKRGVSGAADFFTKERIGGPVFNNYDIGGYLIYYLYPQCRVFVDNRPEAYPYSFLSDVYVKMQEKEEAWLAVDREYKFNAVFFYRQALSRRGQDFLVRRLNDPLWAPVYSDEYCAILLKRNTVNKELIAKYELQVPLTK